MFISCGYSAHTRSGRVGATRRVVSRSSTEDHRDARRVLVGRRDRARARRRQAGFATLALELAHAHLVELHHVSRPRRPLRGGPTEAREHGTLALDTYDAPAHPHARGAADVADAADTHDLR